MSKAKEPRVVAELGRPETPQETVDRRAVASRTRRQNQNFFNLIIALLASLAVVAIIVLVVVRPDAAAVVRRRPAETAVRTGTRCAVFCQPPDTPAGTCRAGAGGTH